MQLDSFRTYYNLHPLSSESGKSPKQLHAIGGLKQQVANKIISTKTLYMLRRWQNLRDNHNDTHVQVPIINNVELTNEQQNVIHQYLNSDTTNKNKCINVRSYLRSFIQ